MENKYLKDFVIALVVILILAFAVNDYYLKKVVSNIPAESKYKEIALSDELLDRIHEIERSIQDRKKFVFTVIKDPLEQNLIVKTKQDLEKQWQERIESIVRLEATIIPEFGDKLASISYQGNTQHYKIGDNFELGKITDIRPGEISYQYNNSNGTLPVTKLTPKPVEIRDQKAQKSREYNW
jgi:hypothetical protein